MHDVAHDLIGTLTGHAGTAGRIVEIESYHMDEPACHAHVGLTGRTHTCSGRRAWPTCTSYGIHSLLNAVCEDEAWERS